MIKGKDTPSLTMWSRMSHVDVSSLTLRCGRRLLSPVCILSVFLDWHLMWKSAFSGHSANFVRYVTFVKKRIWPLCFFFFHEISRCCIINFVPSRWKREKKWREEKKEKGEHGRVPPHFVKNPCNSPRRAYRRGTKREGREKEGKDDTVSLTHEARVCKNLLLSDIGTDTIRSASIAAPYEASETADISWQKKKRKRFRDKLRIFFALERSSYDAAINRHEGREWSDLKTDIFVCLSPSRKKMLLPTRYCYRATRNKWRRLFSLGRHWYRNEVLHFESDISALHLSLVTNTDYLKLLLNSKSNVKLRSARHVRLQ